MNYSVAAVHDRGEVLWVKYVDTYQNSLLKNDDLFVKLTGHAAGLIQKALSEHNKVYIPKGVAGEVTFADIIIEQTNELETNQRIALSKMYNLADYQLFINSAMDFFNYINTFNSLASLGYFITDQNREEKYLEIIESGDESLISDLELYLETKDKIQPMSYLFNKIKVSEKRILECETQEELDGVLEDLNNS